METPLSAQCTTSANTAQILPLIGQTNCRARRLPAFHFGRATWLPAYISIIAAALFGGCDDPYSQRRIAMRREHLHQTATDIADRERDGVRRVREADETLKKWWQRDVDDFERRAPTIGDYFW